jgi:catechol 2,3-dioxygenase-like lactoylglutathione lyase family enzyme
MSEPVRLTHSAPILIVRDVRAAAEYYRDKMGFTLGTLFGDPPSFTIISRDGLYVMLKQVANPAQIVPKRNVALGLWDMYFWVNDVDALHREFVSSGATINYGLCDQEYGCREFAVLDLDGHSVGFGQIVG